MGFWRKIGNGMGLLVNVRVDKWMGAKYLQESTTRTIDIIKTNFTTDKAQYTESFEEAISRLNLHEEDLKDRLKEFQRLVVVYLIIGLGLFSYACATIYQGGFIGGLVALALFCFMLSNAFKFDFWRYQISKRKLGCTFNEWLQGRFGG